MSERTASEKYLIEEIERERDRADRYQAEFAACKALLIAAQKRAEKAEAERAALEPLRRALNTIHWQAHLCATVPEHECNVRCAEFTEHEAARALAALPVEPARPEQKTIQRTGYRDDCVDCNIDQYACAQHRSGAVRAP